MIRNGDQLLQADFVRFYTCGKMALSEDSHHVYYVDTFGNTLYTLILFIIGAPLFKKAMLGGGRKKTKGSTSI
jgi:hypothetical protein